MTKECIWDTAPSEEETIDTGSRPTAYGAGDECQGSARGRSPPAAPRNEKHSKLSTTLGTSRVPNRKARGKGTGASSIHGRNDREVLDCGSPLPLSHGGDPQKSGRGLPQSKTRRAVAHHRYFPPIQHSTIPSFHHSGRSAHPLGPANFSSSTPSRCRTTASTLGTYICVSAGRCVAIRSKLWVLYLSKSRRTVPSPAL